MDSVTYDCKFRCLYTHQKEKKVKQWKDGVLKLTRKFGFVKLLLHSDDAHPGGGFGATRSSLKDELYLQEPIITERLIGEELEFSKHLVQVEEHFADESVPFDVSSPGVQLSLPTPVLSSSLSSCIPPEVPSNSPHYPRRRRKFVCALLDSTCLQPLLPGTSSTRPTSEGSDGRGAVYGATFNVANRQIGRGVLSVTASGYVLGVQLYEAKVSKAIEREALVGKLLDVAEIAVTADRNVRSLAGHTIELSNGFIVTVLSLTTCSARDLHRGALLPIALPPLPSRPTVANAPAADRCEHDVVSSKEALIVDNFKPEIRRLIKESLDMASTVSCFVEPAVRLHQVHFCPHLSRIERNFESSCLEDSFLCDLCVYSFLTNTSLPVDIPSSDNRFCYTPLTPVESLDRNQIVSSGCADIKPPDQPPATLRSDVASRLAEQTTNSCQLDKQRGMTGSPQPGQDLRIFEFKGMVSPGGTWLPVADDGRPNEMKVTEEPKRSEVQQAVVLELVANDHQLIESSPSVAVPAQNVYDSQSGSANGRKTVSPVDSNYALASPTLIGNLKDPDPHDQDIFGVLSDTLQIDTTRWATTQHAAQPSRDADCYISSEVPLARAAQTPLKEGMEIEEVLQDNDIADNRQSDTQRSSTVAKTEARPRKRRHQLHTGLQTALHAVAAIEEAQPPKGTVPPGIEEWWRNICYEFSDMTLHGVLQVRQNVPACLLPAPLPLDFSVCLNAAERRKKCMGDSQGDLVKSTGFMYAARCAQLVAEGQIQPEVDQQMNDGLAEYLQKFYKPRVEQRVNAQRHADLLGIAMARRPRSTIKRRR
eukprot:GHVS01069633.1.p1 GENE.GHVS01069633.1~~GHVS01069633.1.p1  ORF type:complete len:819 (+),score=85.53 GHVS01069633.1:71-2527(+)